MAEKDERKEDDGTAGPRPHGLRQGEKIEELETRHEFLRKNPFKAEAEAKVVKPSKKDEPKSSKVAETK